MLSKKKIISAATSISMVMGVVSPQLAYAYEDENSEYYQIRDDS